MARLGVHGSNLCRQWDWWKTSKWTARFRNRLCKSQDHGIDREAVAGPNLDALDDAVAFRAEHVLHFHGLDHRERLADLDLLALGNRDGTHQSGHGTAQRLAAVGGRPYRHQVGS